MKSNLLNLTIPLVFLLTACSVKDEPLIVKFEGAQI